MTNMFLHVNITVPGTAEVQQRFSDQLKVVLREGALEGWTLEGGFRLQSQADPKRFEGAHDPRTGEEVQYVNIWRLPEDFTQADISKTMIKLAETESYVKLDSMVSMEQQEIIFRINKPTADDALVDLKTEPGVERGRFFRIRHYPFRSQLGTFVFTDGAIASRWMSDRKWKFLGTYQNITGVLNEFWDFWYVPLPPSKELGTAEQELAYFEDALIELVTPGGAGGGNGQRDTLTSDFLKSITADPSGKVTPPSKANPPHDGLAYLSPADYWLAQ